MHSDLFLIARTVIGHVQPFKHEAQSALFKDPVRTAQ
jgi:hypothetical protein